MMRKPLEIAAPEAVGLHSQDILDYIETLEHSEAEMHGLMILRHGKLCTAGWWAPFAPGLRHGQQSHTKTYAATAVGIACTEGILRLDERIIDIFPEDAPEEPDENLKLLTVRDVLCMGCGMDTMPMPSEHWIRDFLHTPVNHKPGTTYMYNSMGSTLLGAIVRKKTGLGLHDYLKPRLFDKIGIRSENLRWACMPDGMEVGGGGLYCTTEDNLRLMKLYHDGGVWDGQRILSEDYVRLATTSQNASATESINNPEATDNFLGYGFQIWMCKPKRAYRADGAMGQFTIVLPEQDMIIAITETASGAHWAQNTLNLTWNFVEKLENAETLPEDPEAYEKLQRKLHTLNIGNPPYAPDSELAPVISGSRYRVTSGSFTPFGGNFMNGTPADDVRSFSLHFDVYGLRMELEMDSGRKESIRAAMNGSRFTNLLGDFSDETSLYVCNAYWKQSDVLVLQCRWLETCLLDEYVITFLEGEAEIRSDNNSPFRFGEPKPAIAVRT